MLNFWQDSAGSGCCQMVVEHFSESMFFLDNQIVSVRFNN